MQSKTARKLSSGILAIIVLSVCLAITTFALAYAIVSVDNNLFHTGAVSINLNDGKPVIEEHEYLFEPGMTVVKDFFLENHSSWDVYYKIYFENLEGGLADVLTVEIKNEDQVLFSGKISDLTRENVSAADDVLTLGERRDLQIWFHFPEEAGNKAQGLELSFDLSAEAVQTKNNPNRLFN